MTVVPPAMQAVIFQGFSQDEEDIAKSLPFICASNTCTWGSYASVGVCSSCNPITEYIEVSTYANDGPDADSHLSFINGTYTKASQGIAYGIPTGPVLNNWARDARPYVFDSILTAYPRSTLTFSASDLMIMSVSMIKATYPDQANLGQWPNIQITAEECALSFCAQRYNSSLSSGVVEEDVKLLPTRRSPASWLPQNIALLSEQQNATIANRTNNGSIDPFSLIDWEMWQNRTDLQVISDFDGDIHLNVSQASVDSLIRHFGTVFPFAQSYATLFAGKSNVFYSNPVISTLYNSANTSSVFANVAKAMTNEIRRLKERLGTGIQHSR